MRYNTAVWIALLTWAIAACRRGESLPSAEAHAAVSSAPASGRLVVTDTGLGPFRYDASIASIRASWPKSRLTRVPWEMGWYAAVEVSRPGARVIVEQQDSLLNPTRPGQYWYVRGDSVVLPNHLPFNAPWLNFRKTYGEGWMSNAGGEGDLDYMRVTFCRIPYLVLTVPLTGIDSTALPGDLASIPDSARLIDAIIDIEKTRFVPCEPAHDTTSRN